MDPDDERPVGVLAQSECPSLLCANQWQHLIVTYTEKKLPDKVRFALRYQKCLPAATNCKCRRGRTFPPGLWSRSPSNFGWLEPEPEIWVPVSQEIVGGASEFLQMTQCFFLFFGPNCSGARVKNFQMMEP